MQGAAHYEKTTDLQYHGMQHFAVGTWHNIPCLYIYTHVITLYMCVYTHIPPNVQIDKISKIIASKCARHRSRVCQDSRLEPPRLPLATRGSRIIDRLGYGVRLRCVNWPRAEFKVGGGSTACLQIVMSSSCTLPDFAQP